MPDSLGELLLGIDLGSSGVKAVLVSPVHGIVASATEHVDLFSDHPGWAEADPAQWWVAVCSLVPSLLTTANVTNDAVAGVAVTGMAPVVVVVNEAGRPLRRAMLQNDARAAYEIREIRERLGDFDLLKLTGSILSQQSLAPTALWLARHEPDVWSKVASVQGSYDWLARTLGASAHVEENWALESGLYDMDFQPIADVQSATGVAWPSLLDVKSPGTRVGEVSADAARATGLRAGTPLVVGGADHVLSAYGAGLVNEGDGLIKLGGAGDILAVSDRVLLDARLYLDKHPVPGKWLPNGCMATSGSLLRWEQSLFDAVRLEELDDAAATSTPGSLLTLPYFLGEKTPLHDPDLRGVMIGMHLGTTRGDIHRSFLEAIAYGFKSHVDVFAQDGLTLTNTRVTNGGSKSRLWREILADVLNRDLVSLRNHPGASYGAAVIAGIGTGLIDDWSYVAGALDEGEIIAPSPKNVALYEERYQEFLQLNDATASLSHLLARSPS
ncbi:MAG: FGGY-family carbohydrate kinase [Acidimicrobiales bacterium]